MITLKNITARNFLSIGNVTQVLPLDQNKLVLVLGENADQGGNESRNGVGTAQPLYSKIKTPTGWTTIGDVAIGDVVSAPDGTKTTIIGKFPQGLKKTYRFTFSDGRTTDACEDHLWQVQSADFGIAASKHIMSSKDILTYLEAPGANKIYIPLITPPIDRLPIGLPKPPYNLGNDLADIIKSDPNMAVIPELCMNHMSLEQQHGFLSGVVDKCGGRDDTGLFNLSTTNSVFADNLVDMVRSMGGIASVTSSSVTDYYIEWGFPSSIISASTAGDCISSNDIADLRNRLLSIRSIEQIGQIESVCIAVDHPSHLYITDNYVVTHNTSMLNALVYALFGEAISPVKLDNLINKTNTKNMLVTAEFDKDGVQYRIERGRKPQIFNVFVNGAATAADNDAQGDSRLTQAWLEDIIGMNKIVFSHIITLNTTTTPFLSMKAAEQRETIELLFGITKLSEKAENLKELVRISKDKIKEEEFRIKGITDSNSQIEKSIQNTLTKIANWDSQHAKNIDDYTNALNSLCELDVDDELSKHNAIADIKELSRQRRELEADIKALKKESESASKLVANANRAMGSLSTNSCPKCEQEIGAHEHAKMAKEYSDIIAENTETIKTLNAAVEELQVVCDAIIVPTIPTTYYSTIGDVYNHKTKIDKIANDLENEINKQNPYFEQQDTLLESIQTIDYSIKESLESMKDHQEFLLKLLTSKDSFVRKKIIEQNLAHLNERLRIYLDRIGSPHSVVFQSNLEVYITEYGRDLDFDIISRGEKTRIILALSWAFRDVYESMNNRLNLLFIDEILDLGLDGNGIEAAIGVCTLMAHEQHRNVFVISHRNELVGKVDSILTVRKENGFTTICSSDL